MSSDGCRLPRKDVLPSLRVFDSMIAVPRSFPLLAVREERREGRAAPQCLQYKQPSSTQQAQPEHNSVIVMRLAHERERERCINVSQLSDPYIRTETVRTHCVV